LSRGASNVIAEALLLLVGISLAAALSSAVLSRVSAIQSRFSVAVSELTQALGERLAYVYATYSPSSGAFVVYLKNVGSNPVYQVGGSTVLFGNVEGMEYLPYCSGDQRVRCWELVEFGVANGVVEPAETVAVYIYNTTSITPPYRLHGLRVGGTPVCLGGSYGSRYSYSYGGSTSYPS